MKLKLERKILSSLSSIGDLYIDGDFFCHTLEDADRRLETNGCSAKVYGQTCIPRGTYKVIIDFSQHFGKDMPHVLDVDCFEGIRIHVGNAPDDTFGCILLGQYVPCVKDFVSLSKDTFKNFTTRLHAAIDYAEGVTLEII